MVDRQGEQQDGLEAAACVQEEAATGEGAARVPEEAKEAMRQLTPSNYTGNAAAQARGEIPSA